MIFDELCKVAEATDIPGLESLVRRAAVFTMDSTFEKYDRENDPPDRVVVDGLIDGKVFLPFPVTCLTFTNCSMILRNVDGAIKFILYDQIGSGRTVGEIFKWFAKDESLVKMRRGYYSTAHSYLVAGAFDAVRDGADGNSVSVKFEFDALGVMDTEGQIDFFDYDTQDGGNMNLDRVLRHIVGTIGKSVLVFDKINNMDNFILESTPVKVRNQKNKKPGKKIPRSHQRSIYTLLAPRKIRRILGTQQESTGTGSKKGEHARRRHWRYLSKKRYRFDERGMPIEPKVIPAGPRKGQLYYKKVDVPAQWIGASEKQIGQTFYRVCLDIPAWG